MKNYIKKTIIIVPVVLILVILAFFLTHGKKSVDIEQVNKTISLAKASLEAKNHFSDFNYDAKIEELAYAVHDPRLDSSDGDRMIKSLREGKLENIQVFFEIMRKKDIDAKSTDSWSAYELGNVYFLLLKHEMALMEYESAEKLSPLNTDYQSSIGFLLLRSGNLDKSLEHFEKALKRDIQTYGEMHKTIGRDYNNLGAIFKNQGQLNKAAEYFQKALDIDTKVLGRESTGVIRDLVNLGGVMFDTGIYQKAVEHYEEAFSIYDKLTQNKDSLGFTAH